MVLGRNVEQDKTIYHIQEWQLCLSYFWRYLPLLYLTVIMHWFRVCSVSNMLWNILTIFGRNVEQMRLLVKYKNDNSGFLTFGVISLCFVWSRFHVRSVTGIPFGIFWWYMYLVEMYNRTRRCVMYKNNNSALLSLSIISFCYILAVIMHWFHVGSVSRTKTLWNILMIHGRNVERDKTMCQVQERQLFLSFGVISLYLFEIDFVSAL